MQKIKSYFRNGGFMNIKKIIQLAIIICLMGVIGCNSNTQTNNADYLICNKTTKECIIVDPADQPSRVVARCNDLGMKPVAILLTHGHFDHILGADGLRMQYGIPIYVHEREEALMGDGAYNLSSMWAETYTLKADKTVKDQELLELAGFTIEVIHTPGHTIGSCCYYIKEQNTLISGDTLFYRSVGRTDFPTSRTRSLILSIKDKLFILPDDTLVYPGHGESTTIEDEKIYNPVAPYCK